MKQWDTNLQSVLQALRHSPHVRSAGYFALMASILEVSNHIMNKDNQAAYVNIHPPAFPFVAAITYRFAQLRTEDSMAWHKHPSKKDIAQLGYGVAVGSAALLSVMALAKARGWISAPAWGWESSTPVDLTQSVMTLTVLDIVRVWDEEMVFRGYGLDVLKESVGRPAAVVLSAVFFALAHGLHPVQFLNMLLFAVITTIQRIESGGLWMPIGFHLAWNLCQCALFGPTNGPLTIRPLHLHGPTRWIGEPGTPEQGWLVTIILGLLAIWLGYHTKHKGTFSK